jgi:hypothetical protein
MRIGEHPLALDIVCFKRSCGAIDFTSSASNALIGRQPGSQKHENDHQQHGLRAQHVKIPHVGFEKRDVV